MNTQVDEKIDAIYDEYLEEADRITHTRFLPFPSIFTVGAIIGGILVFGGLLLRWGFYALFWGGFFWVISLGLSIFIANRRAKKQARKVAQAKPGFAEFFKLSQRRYWPYQISAGEKYDKFLSILGGVEMINESQTQKRQQSLEIADDLLAEAEDAYEQGKDFEIVLNLCEKAIQVTPDNSEAYVLQGTAYEDLGKWDEAIIAYRNALKYNPKMEDAEKGILDVEEKQKHG